MRGTLFLLVIFGLLGPSCAHVKRLTGRVSGESGPDRGPGIPDHMRADRDGGSAPLARVTYDGQGGDPSLMLPGGIPSEDQIEWTDPDNPDAPLEGLEETLATKSSQKGPWKTSYTEATRLAVREGKPILIWFTDTQRSPLCRSLSAEVFSDFAFDAWAGDRIVRLRVDLNVKGDDEDDRLRKKDYVQALKKRYGVLGLPTVLVLAPDGTVTGRYKGYKRGQGDFYFGRIKNATATAEDQLEAWRASMEKRGYRTWRNRQGRQVFAKLIRYGKGEMILVEPSGKRLLAKERQLSDEDQAWIRAELAKRDR